MCQPWQSSRILTFAIYEQRQDWQNGHTMTVGGTIVHTERKSKVSPIIQNMGTTRDLGLGCGVDNTCQWNVASTAWE